MNVPGGSGHPAIAVYGLAGADRIVARSGAADIHSGTGRDKAVILSERYDKWYSDTERVYNVNGRRVASADAAQATTTQFDPSKVPLNDVRRTVPDVKCGVYTDGVWYIRFADLPELRAFNTIASKVEFQDVAFTSRLYKWDPATSRWLFSVATSWYWDETYDVDWPTFPGNFFRTFDTLEHPIVRFRVTPDQPGYYRVAVAYHWYPAVQSYGGKTVNVPAYDPRPEWVLYHFGDYSNVATANYHADRYCAFGVDPAAGP